MTKLLMIIIISFCTLGAGAQIKQANMQASGLTCAMCSNAINKALKKLPFVETVQPNIKESSFVIGFKEGEGVDFDAIRKAVEGAGFSIAVLQVVADFNDVSITNDTHVALEGDHFHFLDVKQQTLQGERTFQIVDKKFVSDKLYKKYAANTKMDCIKTGYMLSCCSKDGKDNGTRIYHVTI